VIRQRGDLGDQPAGRDASRTERAALAPVKQFGRRASPANSPRTQSLISGFNVATPPCRPAAGAGRAPWGQMLAAEAHGLSACA
jgi:hypothetical protein